MIDKITPAPILTKLFDVSRKDVFRIGSNLYCVPENGDEFSVGLRSDNVLTFGLSSGLLVALPTDSMVEVLGNNGEFKIDRLPE